VKAGVSTPWGIGTSAEMPLQRAVTASCSSNMSDAVDLPVSGQILGPLSAQIGVS
jgi:hypothetical protein